MIAKHLELMAPLRWYNLTVWFIDTVKISRNRTSDQCQFTWSRMTCTDIIWIVCLLHLSSLCIKAVHYSFFRPWDLLPSSKPLQRFSIHRSGLYPCRKNFSGVMGRLWKNQTCPIRILILAFPYPHRTGRQILVIIISQLIAPPAAPLFSNVFCMKHPSMIEKSCVCQVPSCLRQSIFCHHNFIYL